MKSLKHTFTTLLALSILSLSLLLTACAGDSDSADPDTGDTAYDTNEWKKIALTIDVELLHDGSSPAATCVGSGAFALDLYFPFPKDEDEDVELAAQDSYFQFTYYDCSHGLEDCSVTLPESNYSPFDITANASLSRSSSDWNISNLYIETPNTGQLTLSPTFVCGGAPGMQPDPALLTQIFSAFNKGYEDRLSGFNIPFGDNDPETINFNWPLYLGNSVEMVLTATASNVGSLPN
jgi:hypothetical protein